MTDAINFGSLVQKATSVLAANDLGLSTKPAPSLYPHQWNWDSCFIAIGLSHVNPRRAAEELRSLLRGQWSNGLVPQIVFNPRASGYFPGPEVWQSERSPDAPRDVRTSGITQPPVLASAALAIWDRATDKNWGREVLRELYPQILRYHRFLYEQRNPDGSGLVVVVHPWESGLDNSPPYLDAGSRVHLTYRPHYERLDLLHVSAKNRPTNKDYDLFVWLLEQMRATDWNQEKYLETAPLQVEDVLFNSILCRANSDLATIAEILEEDTGQILDWSHQTAESINAKLWHDADETYYSFDRVAGILIRIDTIAAFHALYGHVAPPDRARRLVDAHLRDSAAYWPPGGYPVPTTAMRSPWFNPENYWLGPVWVNTNWMLIQGLRDYGFHDLAEQVRETTLSLLAGSGFREYYDPRTGVGYGTDGFSWSAALAIDLAAGSRAS